jgi:hypothetical protein
MSKIEHTPGPWRVFTTTHGKVIGMGERTGEGIADCGFGVWRGGDAEAVANAHLMAAAPELLAVAAAYEEWEADLVMNGDWSNSTVRMTPAQHDRMMEIQAMRNAAIAKATGTVDERKD